MRRDKFCLTANRVIGCFVWYAFFCTACLGQDMDPESVRQEELRALWDQGIYPSLDEILPYPRTTASYLMEECDLVADGQFFAFPYSSPEDLQAIRPQDVRIKFRIHKLYKGEASGPIEIELINDMLVFPGDEVSRYVKREMILEKQSEDLRPVLKQKRELEKSYKAGKITRQEYYKERTRLDAIVSKRVRQDGLYSIDPRRSVWSIHGETFYDRGGAINPETRHLICVSELTEDMGAYHLEEDPINTNIYWGEMRDFVLSGFGELTR